MKKLIGFALVMIIALEGKEIVFGTKMPPLKNLSYPLKTLSQHDQTRLIIEASNAYTRHDVTQATLFYEMMLASGMTNPQILRNLSYLYGRQGSFTVLEAKIKGKQGINEYLYAYGVGALEGGDNDLYHTFSPYLEYDKSGRLSLLCGYFFEQHHDQARAATFYQAAYESAPFDPYLVYAYGRSRELQGNAAEALRLYTQAYHLSHENEPLHKAAQARIHILKSPL
ncbi:MAG: hypothetical protein WA080_05475 [Sulfuricurvum sp.]